MKSWLHLILFSWFAGSIASADPETEIAALLEPIRQKHNLPALAGAVFEADGLIGQAATGVRKRGAKEKVGTGDLWHIGSETKAMTAALTGSFVAEGKLSWDDTMAAHFPEIAGRLDPSLRGVTLGQLLSHRAGLTANLAWSDFNNRNLVRARREAAKELLTHPPEFPVGGYHYSNAGYVVVGSILEKIGGKPWETLMTERIFTPLGIKSAGFGGSGTPGRTDQPWGHLDSGEVVKMNGPQADNPPVMGPAGTVHLSVADWSKFLTDQLKGSGEAKSLLPREIYQTIQSPHPLGSEYGFGWGVARRPWAGGKVLTHAGSNTMNFAVCWLAIPRQFGILVTTNQSGDDAQKASDEAVAALIEWRNKRK